MKKMKAFLVSVLALCGLAACGTNDDSKTSEPSLSTSEHSSVETSASNSAGGNSQSTSALPDENGWDNETKASMQMYFGEVLPYFELGTDFEYEFFEDDYGDMVFYYVGGLGTEDYTDELGKLLEAADFEYYDGYYDDEYGCYTTFYVKEVANGELVFEIDYYSYEDFGEECGNEVLVWLETGEYNGDGWTDEDQLYMLLFLGDILPYFELGEEFEYGFDSDDDGVHFYAVDTDTNDLTDYVIGIFEEDGYIYYSEQSGFTYLYKDVYSGEIVVQIGYYDDGEYYGNVVFAWLDGSVEEEKTDWTDEEKANMVATWGFEIPFFALGEYAEWYFEDGYLAAWDYSTTDLTDELIAMFIDLGFEYDELDDEGFHYLLKEIDDGIIVIALTFVDDAEEGGNEVYGYVILDEVDGEFDFTSKVASESSAEKVVFQSGNSVVVLEKGSNTSTPANNGLPETYGELRVYGGQVLTFSVLEGSIDTITITYSSIKGDKFNLEGSVITGGTVEYGVGEIVITADSNVDEVSIQFGGTSGHIKITGAVVSML